MIGNTLGKTFLTSVVGNYWSTSGLRVNLYSVKGRLIIFPLFLLEGNAILVMTPQAHCVGYFVCIQKLDAVGPVDNKPSTN